MNLSFERFMWSLCKSYHNYCGDPFEVTKIPEIILYCAHVPHSMNTNIIMTRMLEENAAHILKQLDSKERKSEREGS